MTIQKNSVDDKFISELDSLRFGFKIAKVNHYEDSPCHVIKNLRDQGVKLVFSRIPFENIALINELESLGFRIKDSQVTYFFDLKRPIARINNKKNVIVREYRSRDLDSVIHVLEESFVGYGHYFADGRLESKKCIEVYTDWGRRSCLNKNVADIILVAELNNEIAGILSFKKNNKNGQLYGTGGLGSVSSKYRGQHVFKELIIAGLHWGLNNRLAWEEHNVIAYNYPVNAAFSTLGFRITNSFVTLHCWL